MSYLGEVRRTAFSSFGTAASGLLIAAFTGSVQFIKAVASRRHLAQLGEFDDRMLRDIGLTRADLRDASSGPLWQDPTAVLVVRSVERRAARRMSMRDALREAARQDAAQAARAGRPSGHTPVTPRNDDLISCG
ncbi:DUF1127 domain-containing protein [Ancylobacter dichloromethanicus]|uniref:YjiS-like domain-containing protein n=1 Tax=Ancylobacter dichloromethanicus TaxID=518825 RepID=A0A9W6N0V7_9HYPH|nr:DUF1127 domain-containing protein [Ancylobacter dichloromethanicus]MBS7556720.1 DUF1127 domain-containing protein [Ancylobacter dichloromethanicus]GLK73573.1 hypothetical protein GCM10017643_36900 [Ancylobacter dichloromethanicus]